MGIFNDYCTHSFTTLKQYSSCYINVISGDYSSATNKTIDLEASGNITLDTILSIAETGVDYISTGAITKNIAAIDFSLQFIEN